MSSAVDDESGREIDDKDASVSAGALFYLVSYSLQGIHTDPRLLSICAYSFSLCPCAIALYFTDCARNTDHYCSSCNKYIGTYKR